MLSGESWHPEARNTEPVWKEVLGDDCTCRGQYCRLRSLLRGCPSLQSLLHQRTSRQFSVCLVLGICDTRTKLILSFSFTIDVLGHRFGAPARSEVPFLLCLENTEEQKALVLPLLSSDLIVNCLGNFLYLKMARWSWLGLSLSAIVKGLSKRPWDAPKGTESGGRTDMLRLQGEYLRRQGWKSEMVVKRTETWVSSEDSGLCLCLSTEKNADLHFLASLEARCTL